MIFSTSLGPVDALLEDCSIYTIIESPERYEEIKDTLRTHSTILVVDKFPEQYKQLQNMSISRSCSVLPVKSLPQSGEIVAKCALQTKCEPKYGKSVQTNQINCAAILSTVQSISGLGPKQANKVLAHFGSLYNFSNASLKELEIVLGPTTSMTVYQFLH